jgi:hypothetical protein
MNEPLTLQDHYLTLGVAITATSEELRERFRYLSFLYHPDRIPEGKFRQMAEQDFAKLSGAYHVLIDPDQRADYDRQKREHDLAEESWQAAYNSRSAAWTEATQQRTHQPPPTTPVDRPPAPTVANNRAYWVFSVIILYVFPVLMALWVYVYLRWDIFLVVLLAFTWSFGLNRLIKFSQK